MISRKCRRINEDTYFRYAPSFLILFFLCLFSERNKVLARKTRCKKKAEFETLRKQLSKLRTENDRLKELVKGALPNPVTAETLLGCDVQLPDDVTKVVNENIFFVSIV